VQHENQLCNNILYSQIIFAPEPSYIIYLHSEERFFVIEQKSVHWQNRAHFFGIAAQLMRREGLRLIFVLIVLFSVPGPPHRHHYPRGGAAARSLD
jgi:hypothetical protein